MAKVVIEFETKNPFEVKDAFKLLAGIFVDHYKHMAILDTRNFYIERRGGDKSMAYDVTALTTAIAEGKADEVSARQLIADYYDWEIKVAQLLSPKPEGAAVESPAEQPNEAVAETTPEQTVDLTGESEQPMTEQTQG